MEFHPIANFFPMMSAGEFASLKADIAQNGQQEPIWTYEGKIVDGRNRYVACFELHVEPKFCTWTGNGSVISFVVSMNQHRRHLTQSQKAATAVNFLPLLEQEAKARLKTSTGGTIPRPTALMPEAAKGEARQQAAKMMKVGARYVSDAKQIQDAAPELFAEVLAGKKSITKVKREMRRAQVRQNAKLPSDKFRVFYADPPWTNGDRNEGTDKTSSSIISDNDGGAEKHYPAMSIAKLCALDIVSICEENAVLFMWVPSPFLAECFPVIKAWGFSYKASFVWAHSTGSGQAHSTGPSTGSGQASGQARDKGQYNSERHDFLLVCTRGSCLPEISELYDSIERVERSEAHSTGSGQTHSTGPSTGSGQASGHEHSEKPDEFRRIVDALYPSGKRLELFARKPVDGWESWSKGLNYCPAPDCSACPRSIVQSA